VKRKSFSDNDHAEFLLPLSVKAQLIKFTRWQMSVVMTSHNPHLCRGAIFLHSNFHLDPINCGEVEKVITSMPSDKAPGIDKISIRVNKHSPPAILSSVTSIINESLASNTFPMEWKPAEAIPVVKEGDHEKPNNYRPISLLPVLSKLCECIALNQLMPYLVENDRLSVHQSGDKKWHSVQ